MFVQPEARPAGEPQPLVAKPTTLSAAIRLGSSYRPQCRRRTYREGKSCVIAAAYEGLFGYGSLDTLGHRAHDIGFLRDTLEKHFGPNSAAGLVGMNDVGGLTREEIAARLEAKRR